MDKTHLARFDFPGRFPVYINLEEVAACAPAGEFLRVILKSGECLDFDNTEANRKFLSAVLDKFGGFSAGVSTAKE